MPPTPEKSQTDYEKLADAISQSSGVAVERAIRNARTDTSGLSPEQVERLEGLPRPQRWRRVACKSDETGATFTAIVLESRTFPAGRISQLADYKHPPGTMTYKADGGHVPDFMQIMRAGVGAPEEGRSYPKHDLTPDYLQWRFVEFWQKDINRFSGKELKAHIAVDAAAFSTPWLLSNVARSVNGDD